MRSKALISALLLLISTPLFANWKMINNVDYTWGPFKIYNISLFTETGEYSAGIRPIMLTLHYEKPVDGRDFAITLSKSWSKLSISLPNQDEIIDRLKKSLPNFKPEDALSYIALEDKGYFVLNDQVLPEEFSVDVSNAILAIWLDPNSDFSRFHQTLLNPALPPETNIDNPRISPSEVQEPQNSENFVNPIPSQTPAKENIDTPISPELNTEPQAPEIESKEENKPIIDAPIQIIPTAHRKD